MFCLKYVLTFVSDINIIAFQYQYDSVGGLGQITPRIYETNSVILCVEIEFCLIDGRKERGSGCFDP